MLARRTEPELEDDRRRARRRRRRVSSGAPRRPRCGTATSASSTSARSRPTSARGCRTSCSARTRYKLTGSSALRRPPLLRASSDRCCSCRRSAACSPTSSTGAGCSSARRSRRSAFSFAAGRSSRWPTTRRESLIVALVFAIGIANALGAPGPQRDPADARAPRGPARRGRARVGADEPVTRDRPAIGALHLRAARRGAGVRDQRGHVPLRDRSGCCGRRTRGTRTHESPSRGSRRLLSGVRIARRDPLISHILLTLFSFSFFSLAFVGLMPVIADQNLDIGPKSFEYGVLYACFGLGAALGAITVGTVFARARRRRCCARRSSRSRRSLAVFALIAAWPRGLPGRAAARVRVLRRHHVAVDRAAVSTSSTKNAGG